MSENKYKIFRNFMVNELGITKEDIKEWTMQAVNEQAEKYMHSPEFKAAITAKINLAVPYMELQKQVFKYAKEEIANSLVSTTIKKIEKNLDKLDLLEIEDLTPLETDK